MFSKFKDGLAFGAGFSLVYFLVSWGYSQVWFMTFDGNVSESEFMLDTPASSKEPESGELPATVKAVVDERLEDFFELPLEEKLELADFIAIARFEEQPDGRQAAIITDILKGAGSRRQHFEVGDEWRDASYFPGASKHEWNSEAVLIIRAPGGKGTTMGFDGDRLRSFGGISVDDLRKMIAAASEKASTE